MSDAPKRMRPERLEELRTLPEVSGLPYYRMQEGRELIAEIDALRADLARVTAERDAEILRLRTAENAAAVAIDRIRQALTDLPINTHPCEVANAIEADYTEDTERLRIAEATIGYMAEERGTLTAERDEARDQWNADDHAHRIAIAALSEQIDALRATRNECEDRLILCEGKLVRATAERDDALADAGTLAAKLIEVMETHCPDTLAYMRQGRMADHASNALSRHGGGE